MPSFMRYLALPVLAATTALAGAQSLTQVYNRDTGEAFKLKDIQVQTRVLGPIVRNRTVFTFENPYKGLTEASFNFQVDQDMALSSFAYWYKNEYVPGVLMDKQKAWYIYTAITSRNRDPGIMERVGQSGFHAQIYPLAVGYELRVELLTVDVLDGRESGFSIPSPARDYGTRAENVSYSRTYYAHDHSPLLGVFENEGEVLLEGKTPEPYDLNIYAQRFKDGKYYVAGIIRGRPGSPKPAVKGLSDTYWLEQSKEESWAFVGWMRRAGSVRFESPLLTWERDIAGNASGTDAAKLWANQRLFDQFKNKKEALNFSLRYGVPSSLTALLAVPKEEMELFRKKAAEWQRQQREQARKQRAWQENRNQNWRESGGGDPEIRVHYPDAVKVYAVLPDGRVLNLTQTGNGYWGGNFDIPATAREGQYEVKVVAVKADGSTEEKKLSYEVDRNPPQGRIQTRVVGETLVIEVRAEPNLASVKALSPDGSERVFEEVEPGLYRLTLEKPSRALSFEIVLTDGAHNLTRLPWSWQP